MKENVTQCIRKCNFVYVGMYFLLNTNMCTYIYIYANFSVVWYQSDTNIQKCSQFMVILITDTGATLIPGLDHFF